MWKEKGVRVSKKGLICFKDLCKKIIGTDYDDTIDLIDDDDKNFINDKLMLKIAIDFIAISYPFCIFPI
jgi:hypothetical protein